MIKKQERYVKPMIYQTLKSSILTPSSSLSSFKTSIKVDFATSLACFLIASSEKASNSILSFSEISDTINFGTFFLLVSSGEALLLLLRLLANPSSMSSLAMFSGSGSLLPALNSISGSLLSVLDSISGCFDLITSGFLGSTFEFVVEFFVAMLKVS